MPELPEVETVRRGLVRHVLGRSIQHVEVRDGRLRELVDETALQSAAGLCLCDARRRGKYLVIGLSRPGMAVQEGRGSDLLVHLGMTGRLSVVPSSRPRLPHDHVIWRLDGGLDLRFNDSRRFGLVQMCPARAEEHSPRLQSLGVEPLGDDFNGLWLLSATRGIRASIKGFLMDATRVVGVGNIYACEALHRAGIHPRRPAGRLSAARCTRLAETIKATLTEAIDQGGTTLRDFAGADGSAGYFAVALRVYGREAQPCLQCGTPIRRCVQNARSTFYCTRCQR